MYEIIKAIWPEYEGSPNTYVYPYKLGVNWQIIAFAANSYELPDVTITGHYNAQFASVVDLLESTGSDTDTTVFFDYQLAGLTLWHNVRSRMTSVVLEHLFRSELPYDSWVPNGDIYLIDHKITRHNGQTPARVDWQAVHGYLVPFHRLCLTDLVKTSTVDQ